MNEDRRNWPIFVGITAGIVGGIIAAVALHAIRSSREVAIDGAQEIIDRCHDKIREIEESLERLRQPTSTD